MPSLAGTTITATPASPTNTPSPSPKPKNSSLDYSTATRLIVNPKIYCLFFHLVSGALRTFATEESPNASSSFRSPTRSGMNNCCRGYKKGQERSQKDAAGICIRTDPFLRKPEKTEIFFAIVGGWNQVRLWFLYA